MDREAQARQYRDLPEMRIDSGVSMRARLSQKVVNALLPVMLVYMALCSLWSIIRPWTGY